MFWTIFFIVLGFLLLWFVLYSLFPVGAFILIAPFYPIYHAVKYWKDDKRECKKILFAYIAVIAMCTLLAFLLTI